MMMAWLAYISHSHAFIPNKEPKNLYNIDKKARFCISTLIYDLFAFISHNIRRKSLLVLEVSENSPPRAENEGNQIFLIKENMWGVVSMSIAS